MAMASFRNILRAGLVLFVVGVYAADYSIDWSSVATSDRELSNTDLGLCICDLTAQVCDLECCCDPDCSSVQIGSFQGDCKPDGPAVVRAKKCMGTDSLVHVAENDALSSELIDDTFCVVYTSNPSLGSFFTIPDENIGASSAIMKEKFNLNPYQYAKTFIEASTSKYLPHQPIGACNPRCDTQGVRGILSLPSRGADAMCSEGQGAEYLVDVIPAENSCIRRADNLATQCQSMMGGLGIVSGIEVALSPSASSSGVSITISEVMCNDTACATSKVTAGPVWDATARVCHNVLTKLELNVRYNDDTSLVTSVSAKVRLGSVHEQDGGIGVVNQEYGVYFLNSDASTSKIRYRSGNPGYLQNKPLLGGIKTESGSKVALRQSSDPGSSFEVLGTGNSEGVCTAGEKSTILFGVDQLTGCSLNLQRSEIESSAACTQLCSVAQSFHNTSYTHVGKYGDASNLNYNDWLSIVGDTTPYIQGSAACDYVDKACRGIPAKAKYEFLVADVGAEGNPQEIVIGAMRTYETEEWSWRCWGSQCNDTVQQFWLQSTVRFVKLDEQALSEYTPPAPPALPPVADDIFYPFMVEGTSAASSVTPPLLTFLTVFLLCVFMYFGA